MTLIGDLGILWRIWDTFGETKLGKSFNRRFTSKRTVMLLGSTGAGKSQFLLSIDNIAAQAITAEARTEFVVVKYTEINNKKFIFRDIPGQRLHAPRRAADIKQNFQSGKSILFVNTVCFGYHEFGAPKGEVLTRGVVRPEFLEECKRREIDLLNELANLLENETILSVVTKADIWWNQREAVLQHYMEGDYAKRIRALFPNANHIVRAYSSINRRFYDVSRAHDFSDDEKQKLRTELFRVMCEAL